jgi:hypothetical protein
MRSTPEYDAVYAIRLRKVKEELARRQFGAETFESADASRDWLLAHMDKNSTVSYGGSRTLTEIGILDRLRDGSWKLLDRDKPGIDPEERRAIQAEAMRAGSFLASANAITDDGAIVNIDCYANRLAAIAFGPRSVYLVVGRNKLVRTLDDALSRAREQAAVPNATRLKRATPCVSLGHCGDCRSSERICAVTAIHEFSAIPGRITVLLVNADLGM